jgi:hypothetical protein
MEPVRQKKSFPNEKQTFFILSSVWSAIFFLQTTVSGSKTVSELFLEFGSSQNLRIYSDSDPQQWQHCPKQQNLHMKFKIRYRYVFFTECFTKRDLKLMPGKSYKTASTFNWVPLKNFFLLKLSNYFPRKVKIIPYCKKNLDQMRNLRKIKKTLWLPRMWSTQSFSRMWITLEEIEQYISLSTEIRR